MPNVSSWVALMAIIFIIIRLRGAHRNLAETCWLPAAALFCILTLKLSLELIMTHLSPVNLIWMLSSRGIFYYCRDVDVDDSSDSFLSPFVN